MENDNQILKDFFSENKKEIADSGFSRKVMYKIPEKKRIQWIVPVFAFIGVVFTFYFIDIQMMILNIYLFICKLPIVYLVGFFFAIPFISLALWFLNEKKYSIL